MKDLRFSALLIALVVPGTARADTLTITGTSNILGAGHASPPGGGVLPPGISFVAAPPGAVLTFSSVTGSVSYNIGTGSNYNDPDGIGSASDLDVNSASGISGIMDDHAGFLAGVFLGPTEPTDPAPGRLLFSTDGAAGTIQTNFASLAPALNQTFFIGDGLTGDGTGAVQQFLVPVGATRLFLGFADAPSYHGNPGAYDDNAGAFTAVFSLTSVPEPSSLILLGVGLAGAIVSRRTARGQKKLPG